MLYLASHTTTLMGNRNAHILLPGWTDLPPTTIVVAHETYADDEQRNQTFAAHALVLNAYGIQGVRETAQTLHSLPGFPGIFNIVVPVSHIVVRHPRRLPSLIVFLYTRDAQYFAHHLLGIPMPPLVDAVDELYPTIPTSRAGMGEHGLETFSLYLMSQLMILHLDGEHIDALINRIHQMWVNIENLQIEDELLEDIMDSIYEVLVERRHQLQGFWMPPI